ncbi:MAG: META domain-containing protein [Acidimicrobiia bacterium]
MRRIALIAALSFVVSACLGSDFEDSLDGAWQLMSGSSDGMPIELIASHPITMSLDSESIGGTASCNSYGGGVRISNNTFRVSGLAVTEMACSPSETMEVERIYLQALELVDEVGITESGTLTLSGPGVELEFERLDPVPAGELTGTVWVLDGLIAGQAVTAASGERATLELFTDGSFIGSTGCRDISGSYQISGAEVVFTNWGATGDCPAELAEQDSRVVSALEGGFRVEIDADRLTTWVTGDEGLVYRSDS